MGLLLFRVTSQLAYPEFCEAAPKLASPDPPDIPSYSLYAAPLRHICTSRPFFTLPQNHGYACTLQLDEPSCACCVGHRVWLYRRELDLQGQEMGMHRQRKPCLLDSACFVFLP
ncbi:hypothetical protein BCV70DRAFT_102923 [Testicularia cyperi]|uniref:Uncharacterized protein n=1 Tax=Testicularia cyperi TaxID=1882483 RepID=A0A317XNV1_9BASI|nr:hypothetical protein BCV70DRAFT_102923 [Testicularia cyperi]